MSSSVTIQMKEQYFPVVPFITLSLTFESVDEIVSVTILMKANSKYYFEVLFNFRPFFMWKFPNS